MTKPGLKPQGNWQDVIGNAKVGCAHWRPIAGYNPRADLGGVPHHLLKPGTPCPDGIDPEFWPYA